MLKKAKLLARGEVIGYKSGRFTIHMNTDPTKPLKMAKTDVESGALEMFKKIYKSIDFNS
jgi:hypothetical protein